jgi:hypothetical protein
MGQWRYSTIQLKSEVRVVARCNGIFRLAEFRVSEFLLFTLVSLAAEISLRDGIITDKDVWRAHRYLKVTVQQVRVCA